MRIIKLNESEYVDLSKVKGFCFVHDKNGNPTIELVYKISDTWPEHEECMVFFGESALVIKKYLDSICVNQDIFQGAI